MSLITLRDYQVATVADLRASFKSGHRRPLLVSAVGSGKTVMFSFFASGIAKSGKRVLIIAHRDELLDQISDTLGKFRVPHSFCAAGRDFDPNSKVVVGSVMTVIRRLSWLNPDWIIIDEAHHATTKTSWGKIVAAYPKARVIGVTATPWRLSGEALGDVFDDLVIGPSVASLIEAKWLSRYKIFAPTQQVDVSGLRMTGGDYNQEDLELRCNQSRITGDAIAHYRRHCDGKKAIVFCVTVAHARRVADEFQAEGYRFDVIEGAMSDSSRKALVESYRHGDLQGLVSCNVVSEGFDLPAIECGIMLRPTASLGLNIQQVGRCLRWAEGKDHAIILDHAGNCRRHGLPCDEREWSLKGKLKRPKNAVAPVRACPVCFAYVTARARMCEYCGHEFELEQRVIKEVEGELSEVDLKARRKKWKMEEAQASTYGEFLAIAKARGYKPGWAWFKMQARQGRKVADGK